MVIYTTIFFLNFDDASSIFAEEKPILKFVCVKKLQQRKQSTIKYGVFPGKEKDATTIGLLATTRSKQFFIALYVTSNVLSVLNQLCLTFQRNDLWFILKTVSVEFARYFKCLSDYLWHWKRFGEISVDFWWSQWRWQEKY